MSDWKNERKTYASAIERTRKYVESKQFQKVADLVELKYRKERLEENFVKFGEAHKEVVKDLEEEEFSWEDGIFAETDEIYTKLIIDFNRRMKEVETEEQLARLNSEATKAKRNPIPTPILEFGPKDDRNRVLFVDGTVRYLPLNKRAFIEISSDDEVQEEKSDSSPKKVKKAKSTQIKFGGQGNARCDVCKMFFPYQSLSEHMEQNHKTEQNRSGSDFSDISDEDDLSEKVTMPSKVIKVDLREKIEEKAARLNEISKEIKEKQNEIRKKEKEEKKIMCHNCGANHKMLECPKFLNLSIVERWQRVKKVHVCQNCFMCIFDRKHKCPAGLCWCGGFHNSLLCRRAASNQ